MSITDIRLIGADMAIGSTRANQVCPYCNGGRKRERTFSVTRDCHGLLFNCYRASCSERGFVPTSGALVPGSKVEKPDKLRPYYGSTLPLQKKDTDFFKQAFQLDSATIDGRVFVSERDEYVLPVFDARSYISAYMVRRDSWARHDRPEPPRLGSLGIKSPKSLVFPHSARPVQSFYYANREVGRGAENVVIVEDQLSAMRCAQDGVTAVALLGTHLNADRVREISMLQPTEVIIALDADATQAAFKMARKWGLAFNKTRVAILDRDIKDMPNGDVLPTLGVDL